MLRKNFLQTISLGTAGMLSNHYAFSQSQVPEPLNLALVKEFVTAGHGHFDKTKQLLLETPTLLYATYDWGNGDFETALEGAGHVGNKEIAKYLILLGARTNLFVLTMLGETTIVKNYLERFPSFLTARGPHGLTLLHHAKKGGDDSKELLEYFTGKGLNEMKSKL